MTEGEGEGALRTMTEELPGFCGAAAKPVSELLELDCVGEGLFRRMTLGDWVGLMPPGEITPRCILMSPRKGKISTTTHSCKER